MIAYCVLQGMHVPKALVKLQVPTRRYNVNQDITAHKEQLIQGNILALQALTIQFEGLHQTFALLAVRATTVQ